MTSDDPNGPWEQLECVAANNDQHEHIRVVNTKISQSQQFIKVEFDGNKYVGVEYLQILGKLGEIDDTRYLASGKGKRRGRKQIATGQAGGSARAAPSASAARSAGAGSGGGGDGSTRNITKSSKISHVSNSGTYSGYGIEYAYSADYYWCSDGSHTDNCYVIFNVGSCRIDYINIQQDTGYYANQVMIFTSNDSNANSDSWSMVTQGKNKSGQLVKYSVDGKNSKFIKIKFLDVQSCATMKKLQWFGSETGGGKGGSSGGAAAGGASSSGGDTAVTTGGKADYDITQLVRPGYKGSSGDYSGYGIEYAFSSDYYWCSDGSHTNNCFVIFDVAKYAISSITLKMGSGYYQKTIIVSTCDDFSNLASESSASWNEISKKDNLGNGGTAKFDINKKNGNFIKFTFKEVQSCATIAKLEFTGCDRGAASASGGGNAAPAQSQVEEKKMDEDVAVTSKIQGTANTTSDISTLVNVVRSAAAKPGFPVSNLFAGNDKPWIPEKRDDVECFVIFFCVFFLLCYLLGITEMFFYFGLLDSVGAFFLCFFVLFCFILFAACSLD